MLHFQQPGVAEWEFDDDVRAGLRRLMYAASGSAPPEHRWQLARGSPFLAGMVDPRHRTRLAG